MRQEKQLLLDEIREQISASDNFVIFNYEGIGANTVGEFRDEVAKIGGSVEVVPKRVFQKAAVEEGLELDKESLPGHIALLLDGQDSVTLTKTLMQFAKETNAVKVLGGRFDKKMCTADEVKKISKLPGKEELRAQFLGLLEAPMAQTVAVMDAVVSSVVYCLDNKSKAEGTS